MRKIIRYIIMSAAAAAFFSSCGLYKEFERPETAFADSLYVRIEAQADSASIAEVFWEDFFTDTVLKDWIRTGLENNTDLKVAKLKVEEAEAALMAARGAFLPGVNASLSGGVGTGKGGDFSVSLTAGWEADIFGKLTNAKRKAAAAVEQSDAYRQAVESQLVATIANTYYTLLMLDEQMRVSQRTHDNWKENIRTMEALKRAGKTNEAAVLQAKSNQLNVESSMLDLEKSILETENAFAALLGIMPMTIRRGHLNDQNLPIELSTGLPSYLLARRPDVRQAELSLAQAYYATNIAKAAFYPQLSLSGSAGWTAGNGMSTDPGAFFANLAASVLQPVFNKRNLKANLKKAEALQEEAMLQFRQTVLDAGVEVNNALIQWQTALDKMEVDRSQVIHLQAAVWNTQLLMKHGSATYIEVLTAQQKLLQAELAEASDKFAQIQGIINLYNALGGGYQ